LQTYQTPTPYAPSKPIPDKKKKDPKMSDLHSYSNIQITTPKGEIFFKPKTHKKSFSFSNPRIIIFIINQQKYFYKNEQTLNNQFPFQ